MTVRDEDPAAPPMPPEPAPNTHFETIRAILRGLLEDLAATNSRLRPTREFLQARGLTSVDQLDAQGRAELVAHLEETLRALYRSGRIR